MKTTLPPKILDLLLDTVCVVDEQGRYVFVNAACEQLLGYTQEELLGRSMIDLVHPDDRERTLTMAATIMDGQLATHFENRYVHKDGHSVDIMWSARWSEPDRLRLAVARDITPLKRAQHVRDALYQISEAAHTANGLPALCEHIHQIVGGLLPVADFTVALFDPASNTVSFPYGADNSTLETQQQQLVPGTLLYQVITSGQALLTTQGKKQVLIKDAARRNSLGIPLVAGRGVIGALLVKETDTGAGYGAQDKELLEFVSTQIAAVIARKQNETHLLYMAGHDPLTGLPNRALFRDRLDVALSRARRDKEYLALLYLDLNRFKEVNDTYGHDAGDRLLREVAQRLRGCLRESDTVARMGGDEFTVLLTNIHGPTSLPRVINKVKTVLALPFQLEEHALPVSASIGEAFFPADGETVDQLLRKADANMYAAKRNVSLKKAPN